MIKNKVLLGILFFMVSLFVSYSCSKENINETETSYEKQARVVGYLFSDNFSKVGSIHFCKLTHLNLSFANPDREGNLNINGDIDAVITHAKNVNPNIKISISLAGGVLASDHVSNWSFLIDNPENRPSFIKKIIDFVIIHKLDGVDVDLEWDAVTVGYSDFVIELRTALKKHNKLITAALPNLKRFSNISDIALQSFDFINIMAYDMTGPWSPQNKAQHSSFEDTKSGVEFWHSLQNVAQEKLTLGVPFYGYDFTNEPVKSVTFKDMVLRDKHYADQDDVGQIYYNGRLTIEQKVLLASKTTGGIMIWELTQDSFDEFSVLTVIHNKYKSLGFKTAQCDN